MLDALSLLTPPVVASPPAAANDPGVAPGDFALAFAQTVLGEATPKGGEALPKAAADRQAPAAAGKRVPLEGQPVEVALPELVALIPEGEAEKLPEPVEAETPEPPTDPVVLCFLPPMMPVAPPPVAPVTIEPAPAAAAGATLPAAAPPIVAAPPPDKAAPAVAATAPEAPAAPASQPVAMPTVPLPTAPIAVPPAIAILTPPPPTLVPTIVLPVTARIEPGARVVTAAPAPRAARFEPGAPRTFAVALPTESLAAAPTVRIADVIAATVAPAPERVAPPPVAELTFAALTSQPQAAADTAQPAIDLTQPAGLHRVIDRIERLRDAADAGDTRMRLIPDALGPVDLSVKREGDGVAIHFTASEAATRQLLLDAQPRLAELAETRGVRIERATVDAGAGGDARPQHQQSQARPEPPRSNRHAARADTAPAAEHRIA